MNQANKVIIAGRLAADPKQRAALNGKAVVNFAASVRRNCKNKNGDFSACGGCTLCLYRKRFLVERIKEKNLRSIYGDFSARGVSRWSR